MYRDNMIITKGNNYKLDLTIKDKNALKYNDIITREVVRGVVLKGRKILLVYPKDDIIYGTPGGGIDEGETKIDALKREMLEEVGASDIDIKEYIGTLVSIRQDFGYERRYEPTHHYYLVDILKQGKQELIEYEADLNLTYAFIDIDLAIENNINKLKERNQDFLDFYTNQTEILKEIKRIYSL